MSQEIEIEFKNILTKNEFIKLKSAFHIEDHEFILQENHYFDTPHFSIKERGAALRIRKKQNNYVITLKEPAKVGLLETHQLIDEETATRMMSTGNLPPGSISDQLEKLAINTRKIIYFGSLSTMRAEKKDQNGLIVFDHSRYLSIEDYELEYEVDDEETGKAKFLELLTKYSIPIRHTKNKIQRFYEQKNKEMR